MKMNNNGAEVKSHRILDWLLIIFGGFFTLSGLCLAVIFISSTSSDISQYLFSALLFMIGGLLLFIGFRVINRKDKKKSKIISIGGVVAVLVLAGFFCTSVLNSKPTDNPTQNSVISPTSFQQPTYTLLPTNTTNLTKTPFPTNTPIPTNTSTTILTITLNQSANIRSGPGVNYSVVKGAANGEIFTIYGKNEDGTWILIDEVNQYWVKASLGILDSPIESIPIAPTPIPTLTPTITQTSTPTKTNTPVPTNTLPPTVTPIPAISLEDIYDNFENMTEYQFSLYKSEIAGKTVREIVTVGNVDEHGRVNLTGPWSPWLFNWSDFCVAVAGSPTDILSTLNGGDDVHLEATINRIVGNNNYYINCENTLILYYVKITK